MADDKPTLTVGELVAFIENHSVSPDTEVWVERETLHTDEGNWHDTCPGVTIELSSNGYARLVVEINS